MSIFKKEPMTNYSSQVHTTTDYSLFNEIDGNRAKNKLHVKRLVKSMSENYLFTVIIVNEKMQIIDGQHRFDAISQLSLPVHYIICEGYGINEVHVLNANSKTWNADDYLEGYCNLGYTDYLIYRQFKNKYGFGHNECVMVLSGSINSDKSKAFYEGKLKVKNLKEAELFAEKILMVRSFYANSHRRSFIHAMHTLSHNPKFEFTEFMQKMKLQPNSLMDLPTASAYIALIEEIYNYRRRDKVNLRY